MSDRPPDGQLTHISTDEYDGRRFWYLGAQMFDDIDAALPELGTFFALLLVCEADSSRIHPLYELAGRLTRRGASDVVCWGPECELVHDLFNEFRVNDELGLNEMDGVERPRRYLCTQMTTWQSNESLSSAFWYFSTLIVPDSFAAHHAEYEESFWPCKDWLAIVVGDRDDWKDEVLDYLRDPRSCDPVD